MSAFWPCCILLIGGVALYFAQRRKHEDVVSVNAVVDAAADWQRDLTRVPMLLRDIDEQEYAIGDELAQQYQSAQPRADCGRSAHGALYQ